MLTSILAPTTSDEQYIESLVKELNQKNVDETCSRISDVLKNKPEFSRKLILPIMPKINSFVEQNNIDEASLLLLTFNRFDQVFFKSSDLSSLFRTVISNHSLFSTQLLPPFCGLCCKCLNTNEDLYKLTTSPNEIADFVPYASNSFVISFIVKVAQIDTTLRVPLVFNGLIEQILPTISTNDTHLELLSLLISDQQTRKYFIDMGHIPRLLDTLFQTNFSNLATNALVALLYPKDLVNLSNAQICVFNDGAFDRFIEVAKNTTSEDETVNNALKCISSCIFCHPLQSFDSIWLLDVAARRPSTRQTILRLLETLSMTNPSFVFEDKDIMKIEELTNDKYFMLFTSFICYECHKSSLFDVAAFNPANRIESILRSCLCIQRRVFYQNAAIESIDAGDVFLRGLSSVLLLILRKSDEKRGSLIQHAVSLFNDLSLFDNSALLKESGIQIPRSLIYWGMREFCPSRIGYWMKSVTPNIEMHNETVFELSLPKSAEEMKNLNLAANSAITENKRLKVHVKTLLDDKTESEKAFVELEKEIVAAKVKQLQGFVE